MAAPPTATREPLAERERKRERRPHPASSCSVVNEFRRPSFAATVETEKLLFGLPDARLGGSVVRFFFAVSLAQCWTTAFCCNYRHPRIENGRLERRRCFSFCSRTHEMGDHPRTEKCQKKIKKTKQQKKRLTQIDSSRPHCRRPATATATSCASRRRSITYGMIDRCRPAEKTRRPKSTSAAAKVSTARQSAAAEKTIEKKFLTVRKKVEWE